MIELEDLSNYKRGRIWINELPKIRYEVIEVMKKKFKATSFMHEKKCIALEFTLPRNSSNYALLGVNYFPDESSFLNVEIMISSTGSVQYKENIAPLWDEVFCGITKEYGSAILDYICNNSDKLVFPPGKLVFDIGAHGVIGSSKYCFSLLAELILELITMDIQNVELEYIKNKILKKIC